MKKLYNEFFYVPKHGKVRENVMMTRLAVTVVTMLLCLFAITLTAYAYFSYNVSSGFNVIKSANFEADVSIQITDNDAEVVKVNKIDNTTHTVYLEADKTYSVTLDESENSTANTGFCIVTAQGCPLVYHTQQLGADESAEGGRTAIIKFELKVNVSTVVNFISHWGTSSYYDEDKEKGDNDSLYITNGEVISMKITDTLAGNSEFEEETTINTTIPTTSQVTTTAPKPTVPTTVNATTTTEAPTTQPTTTLQAETAPVETTVDSGNVE